MKVQVVNRLRGNGTTWLLVDIDRVYKFKIGDIFTVVIDKTKFDFDNYERENLKAEFY